MLRYAVALAILFLSHSSWAQMSNWGTGLYGGMQGCQYPTRVAQGAVSEDDSVKEIQSEIKEAQAQLKAKKSEKKKVDREAERAKSQVTKTISDDYADFIFEHIENSRRCSEYKGSTASNQEESVVGGDQGGEPIANQNLLPVQSFSSAEWSQYCDGSRAGAVNGSVCSNPRFKSEGGRSDASSCKKGLTDYRKGHSQSQKLQQEITQLEDLIKQSNEALKDAKKDAREAQRDQNNTEGGVCIECLKQGNSYSYQQPQTDWSSVIGNVALGLGSVYMGYQTNKMISENNANLGWPTNPYASVGYGYGLGAMATGVSQALGGGSGMYGSMSGAMGSGAFGCAGTNGGAMGMMGPFGGMNGYGMWGNPYGMSGYGMMGGGMFNTGMGPWGMNGYGMMTGYPSMMGMGTMMSTLPGYGTMMGTGMMVSTLPGYGNMMGYGSMMGMGTMMGYDPSMSQYQQQLMQMQMQQYQNYYQYQQQYQQQNLAKYQTMSSLQQEMYTLMYRMQQVQYGYGTGYIGGSIGTGTSGYSITPLPTTTTGTTSLLPR